MASNRRGRTLRIEFTAFVICGALSTRRCCYHVQLGRTVGARATTPEETYPASEARTGRGDCPEAAWQPQLDQTTDSYYVDTGQPPRRAIRNRESLRPP